MPLSCALRKLQSGGAGGRATRDQGDASVWWTNHVNDPVEGESVTHKITGNRLIDVEALAAVSTLSYSSISSTRTEAALDDFVTYLQENGAIDGITTQQHLQNWKEGRGKELLDSDVKKIPLELHESRTGIASSFSWKCTSESNGHDDDIWFIPKKMLGKRDTSIRSHSPRVPDFEHNARLVIAMQMNGSGGEDAAAVLGMLNMPGGARMRHTNFIAIEQEIAQVEIEVAHDAIRAGLDEEIKRTVEETMGDMTYEQWRALSDEERPRIGLVASFDTGWQKRSSGNTYDSLSGHAAFYGQRTGLMIALKIMSKKCTTCDRAAKFESEVVPEHNCPKNHEGSSKSMEPLAAVELLKSIYDHGNCYISTIVSDDDSTTAANCKHSHQARIDAGDMTVAEWPRTASGAKKKDAGLLPLDIPEPENAADPTHRAKCAVAKIFGLKKTHGTKGTDVTYLDAHRLKMYWGHWQKQSRNKPFDEFKRNSNAVIEHLFDDHTYCSHEWCPVLKAQAKLQEYKGVYRCKVKHAREYEQIKSALAPYLTDAKLKEIHHLYDSQKNESFNKSVSKYAPKDRTYSMTMALTARINIAAGVGNLGPHEYWTRVMERLGIAKKGEHTEAFLLDKTRRKKNHQDHQRRIPVKRHRAEKKSQKWRETSKRQGKEEKVGITYKAGVRNDDDEDESDERPSKRVKLNKKVGKVPCERCGRWDHMRLCKSCPQSNDYPRDHDVLYEEWETDKRSKGEIPDINGEEGHRPQDSAASEDEQNLDREQEDSSPSEDEQNLDREQ
jgi:hypothetical protein